jgi:hypothetical protein
MQRALESRPHVAVSLEAPRAVEPAARPAIMKLSLLRGSPVLLAALLGAMPAGDKLSFHPENGLSLKRNFSSKQEITLDDMSMSMNGQPTPMPMEIDMNMNMSQTLEVVDVYKAVKDGRVEKLVRSFDTIESNGDFNLEGGVPEPQEKKISAKTELQGKKVQFAREAGENEFKKSYTDSDGDEKLLEGLEEDMDLRGLLPEKEVSDGDTWKVELDTIKRILMPGGQLGLKPEKDGSDSDMMGGMDDVGDISQMLDELEGDATAEYKGSSEADGVKVGKVHLRFKIKSSKDMSDKVREAMAKAPDRGFEMEVDHMDVEVELEGEGDLLWNLAGGYAHSFEMSGKLKTTTDMGFKVNAQGKDMDIAQNMAMSGNYTLKAEIDKN